MSETVASAPCSCSLKGDPYKAPEQHGHDCAWRARHPLAAAVEDRISKLTKERDEARAQLADQHDHNECQAALVKAHEAAVAKLEADRDEARLQLNEAMTELVIREKDVAERCKACGHAKGIHYAYDKDDPTDPMPCEHKLCECLEYTNQ